MRKNRGYMCVKSKKITIFATDLRKKSNKASEEDIFWL